mmetsp:Transcript_28570/g.50613  ORF Transcript_28570/g.50613 Transcript_28570/m.50613 type:complete len:256 (+) Transcript_28570:367-1134(+)
MVDASSRSKLVSAVTRWRGGRSLVSVIIFSTYTNHWPVVEPLIFVSHDQISVLFMHVIRVFSAIIVVLEFMIQFILLFHPLALLSDPRIPIFFIGFVEVFIIDFNFHRTVVRIVAIHFVVINDVCKGSEFWFLIGKCTLEGSTFLARRAIIYICLSFQMPSPISLSFERKTSRIGRIDWIETTLQTRLVFFSTPLANHFIQKPIRRCIVVGFHKHGNGRHFIVVIDGIKMIHFNLSRVAFPLLCMLRWHVYINVR